MKKFDVKNPLVIMFEAPPDHSVVCHLYPSENCDSYEGYGLLVCDLVRHVAKAFNVHESAVWEWVEKERHRPTAEIRKPS